MYETMKPRLTAMQLVLLPLPSPSRRDTNCSDIQYIAESITLPDIEARTIPWLQRAGVIPAVGSDMATFEIGDHVIAHLYSCVADQQPHPMPGGKPHQR